MSLRPACDAKESPAPSRFHQVLRTGMMAEMNKPRKVMVLKGLVFGIPDSKYKEAFDKALELIKENEITTICWDGDKYTYPGNDGKPAAASFTRLIVALHDAMPHLEFIYFKKQGKAIGLINDASSPEADQYGNVLGPFPFLTTSNTKIVNSTDDPPAIMRGMNYGVEFSGDMKWYELGLKGLMYIKEKLDVHSVTYMVFGLGGAVSKELEKVAEAEDPSMYPSGISKDEIKVIQVVRD